MISTELSDIKNINLKWYLARTPCCKVFLSNIDWVGGIAKYEVDIFYSEDLKTGNWHQE